MGKSRKSSSVMKSIKKTASKTLPIVNKSLTTVGTTAKSVAKESIPILEKGVSAVYGTMSTGLDLGIQGVESVTKSRRSKRSRRHSSRSRSHSRSLYGGRRTRRRRH